MVSQPRALQSAHDRAARPPAPAAGTTQPRPPLVAPSLQPTQSLPRLLAVIVLTGLVVVVWSLRDDPAPVAGPQAQAITVLGGIEQATPTAEIAAPEGVAALPPGSTFDLIQGPSALASDASETADLPRLRPSALPRPPELSEPIQPGSFIHFIAQPGDTIYDVSIVYGVPIDEILRFNPALGDGTQISVGQLIFVPDD